MLRLLVILSIAALVIAVHEKGSARDNNNEGLRLGNLGETAEAYKYFKLAAKADPRFSAYSNNAGVAAMRLNKFKQAKRHFEHSLAVQPNDSDTLRNIAELKKYAADLFTNDDQKSYKSPSQVLAEWKVTSTNRHRVLPRIHIDDLTLPQHAVYFEGKAPFILTGAFQKWNIAANAGSYSASATSSTSDSTNLFTFDWFASTFATSTVDFYPHNMPKSNSKPYLIPMGQAISEMQRPTSTFPRDRDYPGSYIQFNMRQSEWSQLRSRFKPFPEMLRFDDMWLKNCLETEDMINEYSLKVHWRMALIGSEGAGMFLHQDVLRTGSWQVQLHGSKLWFLCAPNQSSFLYGDGASDVDAFRPDYDKYPNFRQADCYMPTVRAGEMLFYPADYWHQTRNLNTPSIALTGTVLDQNNWRIIKSELEQQCDNNKWNWHFSPELCAKLKSSCFEWWRMHFDELHRIASDLSDDLL